MNKMAGCHPEGNITDRRNMRMKRRIKVSSEGG
jgi:hypothetical protein